MLQVGITHINPKVFGATHSNPRIFAAAFLNPKVFGATEIWIPFEPSISNIVLNAQYYYQGTNSVSFTADITNAGGRGEETLTWQMVDLSNNILFTEDIIESLDWRSSGSISVENKTAPSVTFKIRAKFASNEEWNYSGAAYILPVEPILTINSVSIFMIVYGDGTYGTMNITNSGVAGSKTIEIEIVKTSDLSILASGTINSGTIYAGQTKEINFSSSIYAAVGLTVKLRARLQGDSVWVYSGSYTIIIISPPPNPPIPRG
jgi:hypothetical protein